MGQNVKVSVVIPFYNRIGETVRAIKSVQKQTYSNLEIILVNDGSSVDIQEVLSIVREDERIKLLENENNAGVSVSRNKGIMMATGKYVAFLDSDDEFMENKIELQLKQMQSTNAVFSHTSYLRKWSDGESIVHSGRDSGHCAKKMMYNCLIATPTVMFDNAWAKSYGLLFDENIKIGEDTCLWLEAMKTGTGLCGIDVPLSIVNTNQKSSAYDIKKQVIGLKNILRYLLNDEYYKNFDPEIMKMMENCVFVMKRECGTNRGPLTVRLKRFFKKAIDEG